MQKFIFTLFLILFSTNCFATQVQLPNTEVKYITSKINGVELTKDVDKFMKEKIDGYKFVQNHWNDEKFKNFIERELVQYIDKNYRTSKQNALLGHSLGGLFTTFMMLNNFNTFGKYLALSPVIKIASIINNLDKYKSEREIAVYFIIASLEHDNKGNMVKDLEIFYSKLPKENIKSKMEIIQDEDHISIVPIGVMNGLRFLFGKNYEKHA